MKLVSVAALMCEISGVLSVRAISILTKVCELTAVRGKEHPPSAPYEVHALAGLRAGHA